MKRLIIITIILLAAAVTVTVAYFGKLNPPGKRTSQIMGSIPDNAALIFEFNNDASFYDIYDSSALLYSVTGRQKLNELQSLRSALLKNPLLSPYFSSQNIFVSVHPQSNDSLEYLITLPAEKAIPQEVISQLQNQSSAGTKLEALTLDGKPGYLIRSDSSSKSFYIINKGNNLYAGSFSKSLLTESARHKIRKKPIFDLLPDQQNSNSLANLYINNMLLPPLLERLFKDSNPDLWNALLSLNATASLSLNYKSDALMFNGFTNIDNGKPASYLNLFRGLKPVDTHLKDIFPATTAYSCSFAIDDGASFEKSLIEWEKKADLSKERRALFRKIKAETGVNFDTEFTQLLGNEFAMITTRFQEKVAIIKLKNGSKLLPYINNISTADNEQPGQLNYDRLPFYLLGDAFNILRRPYFLIIDNYLVLANHRQEIQNFQDNYNANRFLSVDPEYQEFDDLLAQRSNAEFFIHFKNSSYLLKRILKPGLFKAYQQSPGLNNYYAACYQLTASDNNFYTNFCMKLNQQEKGVPRK